MNIIVCCKQILDPEIHPSTYKIDKVKNKVVLPYNVSTVINPFDENAVEAALRIKDKSGGKIIILSLGNNLAKAVVKKPLTMGADELFLLEDKAFEDGDSWSTAYALAKAIKKIGTYDLILCGRQAADWDSGQVGLGLAELLGIPCITLARKIEIFDEMARIERTTDDGYQIIESLLPTLITVGSEIGEPRYPTIKGIKEANKKNVVSWKPDDIKVDVSDIGIKGRRTQILRLYQPIVENKCEMIDADTLSEGGIRLADKLREANLI